MNIPDNISYSLETMFWVKILIFFDADPDPGIFLIRDLGWKKCGSVINIPDLLQSFRELSKRQRNPDTGIIPDPQHCLTNPLLKVLPSSFFHGFPVFLTLYFKSAG
jgi:hypothetical protein